MPKTESSPLSIVQKQAEVTKKAVDKLLKECNKIIKDKKAKDKETKQRQLFKECFQLKKDVHSVHGRAEALTADDEPKKVKNYTNKRDFEINRLHNLENQLSQIMPKLAPEEDEEAFLKELKEAGEISDSPLNEEGNEEGKGESEDEVDNAAFNKGSQEELKDSPKEDKKNKKDKKDKDKKDKDKKDKEKDKKEKDKEKKDKDKKEKDKKGKDKKEDEEDGEEDRDEEVAKKADKDKGKDKKEKEKDKKDQDMKKKEKDKKDKDNKDKDKDKKEKDLEKEKEKKEKTEVVEVPKDEEDDGDEWEDTENEEEEEDEEEDIVEDIEGDDEDGESQDEDDDDKVKEKLAKKANVKQMQPKTSPKDETDNIKKIKKDEEEEESEEEDEADDEESDNDEVEDSIQPEKSQIIASTPKPASRTLPSKSAVEDLSKSSSTPKPASRSLISKNTISTPSEKPEIREQIAVSTPKGLMRDQQVDDDDEDETEEESDEEEEEKEKEGKKDVKKEKEESEEEDEEDDDEEEEEDEEDEDEEDEEEDDDEDEKEEDTMEVTQPTTRFVAIDDFEAVEKGDLSVKEGEIIRIVEVREDGWWLGENDKGQKGLVPKTYLQMYNPYKDIQQQDEDKEEEDKDKEEKEESEEEEEEHKTGEGKDDEDGGQTPGKRRSGRELWGSLKKTVNETLVTDVLHAMGAGPSGFRLPTVSKYFNESEKFRMKNFLTPKLSESNLGYRDLLFNPATGQMRAVEVRLERIITITSCQQIPPPATGLIVQRRFVRMCLFDGQNVLSNIHTIRVAAEDKTERNWSFNSRISDIMDVQLHNEFFIRSNSTNDNIGILFELCISCVKTKTEERGEFSCGWVHLPLTDKTGVPIATKNYDLYVHGGTPYERDVEVDPSVSRRASSNALVSLISGNKQPRLIVKVSLPNKEQKAQLDLLPETLVGDMCLLPFYSYYRQILADTLIIKRLDLDSTEPIHSPFLRQFPEIADHPDLLSLLRETWINKLKSVKRAERPGFFFSSKLRDVEIMKELFQEVFMESVYPVISSSNFVKYKTGNTEIEMKRKNVIEKFCQVKRERKSALAALLASDIVYTPFDMSEVTFNVINPYCLSEKFVPIPVEG